MKNTKVDLVELTDDDREQFILDNQYAFKYGAMEEFGMRDNSIDKDGEIISRKTIEESIDAQGAKAYRIMVDGRKAGGVVLNINEDTRCNELELLFVSPQEHGRGIGYAAWQAVERLYPQTDVWETFTPYFKKRNIHFYMNKCGFSAVEFYNQFHIMPNEKDGEDEEGPSEMFRLVKIMNKN